MGKSIYKTWNFWDNPFFAKALEGDNTGKHLLVGRTFENAKIQKRICDPPKAVTIEGFNGVGKSSLINVALYDLYMDFQNNSDVVSTLYIPCNITFQLSNDRSIEEFTDEIYLALGQTLISRSEELQNSGFNVPEHIYSVDKWLNTPKMDSFSFSFSGFGGGQSSAVNSSIGFEKSGFRLNIKSWLQDIFPTRDHGGVVCIIDNLELLETSENARRVMEGLRDELFNIPGIRWIFCGAMGIVNSLVATPRLQGFLHTPIEIKGIDKVYIGELFKKRIEYFSIESLDSYIPLNSKLFEFIYEVTNENLRNSLSICDQYCLDVEDMGKFPDGDSEKETQFMNWFNLLAQDLKNSLYAKLGSRALKLFSDAIEFGGTFSPSDFIELKFKSMPAMRTHIQDLAKLSLISITIDENDSRRKTIQVTSKGWLLNYAINHKKKDVL